MGEDYIKETQNTLGKIIKKPPMTTKLLNKPPFRFLHDIITEVMKETGFMKGLYTEAELDSSNVKDKESKIAFLQKAIDLVVLVTGTPLSVRPSKVVAGHEPDKTNEFLQAIAKACKSQADSSDAVQRVLKGEKAGTGKPPRPKKDEEKKRDSSAKKESDKDKKDSKNSSDNRNRSSSKDKDGKRDSSREKNGEVEKGKDKEGRQQQDKDRGKDRSKDRSKDRVKDRSKDRDKERSKDREKDRDKERSKDRDKERSKDRDRNRESEKQKDRSKDKKEKDRGKDRVKDREKERERGKDRKEREKDRGREKVDDKEAEQNGETEKTEERERKEQRKRTEDTTEVTKPLEQNETHDDGGEDFRPANGENEDGVSSNRIPRPSSAKGQRRRPTKDSNSGESDQKASSKHSKEDQVDGEENLRSVPRPRRSARPSSARPAPPRLKKQDSTDKDESRVGSGKQVSNVIVDNAHNSEDEESFVVEETQPLVDNDPGPMQTESLEDGGEHGGLVKKILETKKELEGAQNEQKEEKKPVLMDAAHRKQRELVQREVEKLRGSIQTLTRSANPLGKIMDYLQEDVDSMQKELEMWKRENREQELAIKREQSITDSELEPLKAQLAELEQSMRDQVDAIATVKSNILKNDERVRKMMGSVAFS